jgi:hypothetical protein
VPVSALRRNASWLQGSDPAVVGGVKHPQVAVVLFAIVASEDVKVAIVESGRVILYLRSLDHVLLGTGLNGLQFLHWLHLP